MLESRVDQEQRVALDDLVAAHVRYNEALAACSRAGLQPVVAAEQAGERAARVAMLPPSARMDQSAFAVAQTA